MIEFSSNGIAVPKSWDGVYEYVAACRAQVLDEWMQEHEKLGRIPDIKKDDRDIYILERSDRGVYRWHHHHRGSLDDQIDGWQPVAVVKSSSYADDYMHGFQDAMEAVEKVFWNHKKRVSAQDIQKMVKYLVEMERI